MAISAPLLIVLFLIVLIMLACSELTVWKIAILTLMLVPSAAQGVLSGTSYSTPGIVNLSLVGYTSILVLFYVVIRRRGFPKKQLMAVFVCFAVILFMRIVADGIDFISNKLLDNYLLPMIMALSMVALLKAEYIPALLRIMYACIFMGAIIACIEYFGEKSILYHEYYLEACPWYDHIIRSTPYVGFRTSSLFGHPLTGAVYYALGIIYLFNCEEKKSNKVLWGIQFLVLIAALFTTNARSAVLGAGVYIIYYLFSNKRIGKIVAFGGIALLALVCVDWSSLYELLFARDISGSSLMVRVRALLSIVDIPLKTLLIGDGYNNTRTTLGSLGFTGNLEIAYLIILYENGIIGFIAWLGSLISLYGKRAIRGVYDGVNAAGAVKGMLFSVLFIGGMSNSFGDPGTLNYLIFILLAFTLILSRANNGKTQLESLNQAAPRKRIRLVVNIK